RLADAVVIPLDAGVLRFSIKYIELVRVDLVLEPVAAAGAIPQPLADAAVAHAVGAHRARAAPGTIVLKAGAHVVRMPHVGRRMVGKADRPEAEPLPPGAPVPGHV